MGLTVWGMIAILGATLIVMGSVVVCVILVTSAKDTEAEKQREFTLKRDKLNATLKRELLGFEYNLKKPKPIEIIDPKKKEEIQKASEADIAAWADILKDPFTLFEGTDTKEEVK